MEASFSESCPRLGTVGCDLHVQQDYSTEALPDVRCMKGRSTGSSYKHSEFNSLMEPDLSIGRVGCPSPPLLASEALKFLRGLVCCSTACATSHQAQQMGAPKQMGTPNQSLQAAEAALRAHPLPSIKAVVLTGDFVYSPKNTTEEVVKSSMKAVFRMLFEIFPQGGGLPESDGEKGESVQLLLVPGNHDIPNDFIFPTFRKDWADLLYETWRPALPDDEITRETFLRGLYYSTTLKGAPSVRVLCLNTILYFVKTKRRAAHKLRGPFLRAPNIEAEGENLLPGQFAWLEGELRTARSLGQRVLICGHILPGVTARLNKWLMVRSNWEEPFALRYKVLISRYSDIVVAQLFGHEHDGEVRALQPPGAQATINVEEGGVPCGPPQPNGPTAILTCPSLTPVDGNNPAVRVLVLEATREIQTSGPPPQTSGPPEVSRPVREERPTQLAFRVADYVQYRLPLYGFVGTPPSAGEGHPSFVFEYSFQKTFGPLLLPPQEEGGGEREQEASSQRCIDGSTALHLLRALNRSAYAFALYQHHRIAGGLAVSSPVLSCSSQCVTKGETLQCMQRPISA
ncbi:hypothetical protein Esti_002480 [Eimeria stiedai]